jgi:hypothetical protein
LFIRINQTCTQIVIDTKKSFAQIQFGKKKYGPIMRGYISVQPVDVLRERITFEQNNKGFKNFAVCVHVGEDYMVLGVFLEESQALLYVEYLSTETSLTVDQEPKTIITALAGFQNLITIGQQTRFGAKIIQENASEPVAQIKF